MTMAALTGGMGQEVAAQTNRQKVIMARDTASVIDIDTLEAVTVTSQAARRRVDGLQIGAEKIEMKELAKMPVLFGERDIMKSIQLLPGIKSDGDGSCGYQVRGGTSAQNLIQLDGAPVFNAGHLLGFFSTFNDDALINATLYKGQVPAQLGGGVASVFDISTKTGDMSDYHFGGNIGLLSAKAYAEGPIIPERASFFVGARRSYLDIFLKAKSDLSDTKLNFFDINAKVNYQRTTGDNISLSFFVGRDNMGLKDILDMKWSNMALSGKWYHMITERAFVTTTATYSQFYDNIGFELTNITYKMDAYNRQVSAQGAWTLVPSDGMKLRLGAKATYIALKSAEWDVSHLHQRELRHAAKAESWAAVEAKVGEHVEYSAGLRMTAFMVLGGSPYYDIDSSDGTILETYNYRAGEIVKTYITPEPRVSVKVTPRRGQSIKLGYSRTSQDTHAIRNTTSSSMPFDRYTMCSNIVRPELAHQFCIGYASDLGTGGTYDMTAEAYYKNVSGVYDYRDGQTFSSEIEMERLIRGGRGRAYGIELCAHKNTGRLTGWASYTLSWSENKIAGINGGEWYDASNDRRHDISIVGTYRLTPAWDISATWVYNTGQALTAPSAKYEIMGETHYYYNARNEYRAPSYHRLDVSATHSKRLTDRISRQINFGVYNIYGRRNPYMIMFTDDENSATGTKCKRIALFSFVPSFSYSIKF